MEAKGSYTAAVKVLSGGKRTIHCYGEDTERSQERERERENEKQKGNEFILEISTVANNNDIRFGVLYYFD